MIGIFVVNIELLKKQKQIIPLKIKNDSKSTTHKMIVAYPCEVPKNEMPRNGTISDMTQQPTYNST